LIRALRSLSKADRRMKRSGLSGQLILEHVILSICQTAHSANASAQRPDRRQPDRRR